MKQDKRLLTDWAWLAAGVLGALLFALPVYFVNTAIFGGWPQALLAYPRMCAARLLWALLMLPARGRSHGGRTGGRQAC